MHLTIPDAVFPEYESLTVDTEGVPGLLYLSLMENVVALDVQGAESIGAAVAAFLRSQVSK